MTYKSIIEAKRKPALNPAAKVLGNNASPEVKAEVDRMVGKLLAKGKVKGIGKDEYTEEDILNIFKDEPDWSQQDLVDVKTALDQAPKINVEPEVVPDDANGMDQTKLDTLNRMEKIMGNMNLKQIKILRAELAKEIQDDNA